MAPGIVISMCLMHSLTPLPPPSQGTNGCYNGPTVIPENLLCCDHFDVPGECIPRVINTTAYPEMIPYINQTELSPTCKNQPSMAPSPTTSMPSSSPPSPKSGTVAAPGLWALVLPLALALLAQRGYSRA